MIFIVFYVGFVLISTPVFADVTAQKTICKSPPIAYSGKIKHTIVEVLTITEQVTSYDYPHNYNVVFKAYSYEIIRMPQIIIKSDIETKTIKLAGKISPKSYQTSTSFVKSTSKSAISVSLENNTKPTKSIEDLKNNVIKLQEKVTSAQLKINQLNKEKPVNYEKIINELNIEICKNRNQINEARSTLYQILKSISIKS